MNIFYREMKAYRKSLLLWCIGVFVLIASSINKYETLSSTGQSLNEIMGQMPRSLRALFGIGSFDLSTLSGYYGVIYVYLALMAGIHAAMLGSGIVSKEERDRTAEFLLVKPISRNAVMSYKLLAGLVNVVLFNVAAAVSSVGLFGIYAEGEGFGRDVGMLMSGMFLLQLMFLCVGTGVATASRRPKSASAVSAAVLLASYVLFTLVDFSDRLAVLGYFTPFAYFKADRVLADGGLGWGYVVLAVAIIAALVGLTYSSYSRRDLQV